MGKNGAHQMVRTIFSHFFPFPFPSLLCYIVVITLVSEKLPMMSLIDFLANKGVITPEQANKFKAQRSQTLVPEEKILLDSGAVTEEQLAKAKAELFNIPYVNLADVVIPNDLISGLDISRLTALRVIPFKKDGNKVFVAMADPFDVQAIQALQHMFPPGTKIVAYVATPKAVEDKLSSYIGEKIHVDVSNAVEEAQTEVTNLDEAETESLENADIQNAPIARILNSILQYAIKVGASDIHIEPEENRLRVRFRINGIMVEKVSLPKKLAPSIVARVKILAKLKLDEKRIPQDGRFQVVSSNKKVDIRVSVMPTIYGEKVVMRLLDSSGGVPPLETTGLRGSAYKAFVDALKYTNGIILISGPTGSGKTRTLAGALAKLNKPTVNIITLENPVEIRIPGVTQVQINPDVGFTFATGLRSVLRQDPDIIMVGEIRDEETAKLAVEASLTGHLVLSTIHTNSAAATIPRLIEMGIEPYLLASTLRVAVAQRLTRRICPYCKEAYIAPEPVVENIKETLSTIRNFDVYKYAEKICHSIKEDEHGFKPSCPVKDKSGHEHIYLYRGKGCERCNNTGYLGRIGIFEVLMVTEKISQMMLKEVTAEEIEEEAVKNGMIKMIQDGYLKAIEGITTIEEVLRVSKE